MGQIAGDVADSANRVANNVGTMYDDVASYATEKVGEVDEYRRANRAAHADGTSMYRQAEKALGDLITPERPVEGPQNWRESTLANQALQESFWFVPAGRVAQSAGRATGLATADDAAMLAAMSSGKKALKVPTGDITKGVTKGEFPMHPSRKKALFNKAIADDQDKRAMEIIMAERTAGSNARNYGRSYYGL